MFPDKNPTQWFPDQNKGYLQMPGLAFIVDQHNNFIIDQSKNFIVTTPNLVVALNPSEWTEPVKTNTQWSPTNEPYTENPGSAYIVTNSGKNLVTNSGKNLVTNGTYKQGNNPTVWTPGVAS